MLTLGETQSSQQGILYSGSLGGACLLKKQPCMVTPANTPNRDTQYIINKHLFQIEPRMAADKVTFLAGNELPEAALVRTLLVATGDTCKAEGER